MKTMFKHGSIAKILYTATNVIVMYEFKTIFFDTDIEAKKHLLANGYHF